MNDPEKVSHNENGTQYLEVPRAEFVINLDQILRSFTPANLDIGNEDDLGDLKFRLFSLPVDPDERQKVIKKIQSTGTDRIDASFQSRYDSLYKTAAEEAGVDPMDVFDVMNGIDLRRYIPTIMNPPDNDTHLSSNALLVYNAKYLRQLKAREYTFEDLSQRQESLLAIIGFK